MTESVLVEYCLSAVSTMELSRFLRHIVQSDLQHVSCTFQMGLRKYDRWSHRPLAARDTHIRQGRRFLLRAFPSHVINMVRWVVEDMLNFPSRI